MSPKPREKESNDTAARKKAFYVRCCTRDEQWIWVIRGAEHEPINIDSERRLLTWKHLCRSAGYSSSKRNTFSRKAHTFSGDNTDSRNATQRRHNDRTRYFLAAYNTENTLSSLNSNCSQYKYLPNQRSIILFARSFICLKIVHVQ